MNRQATSREELLKISEQLAREAGFGALGIRDLAARGGVSVGCIYNYFPSKAALMAATVESVWRGMLEGSREEGEGGFPGAVQRLFDRVRAGSEGFPDFFSAHAAGFSQREAGEGRQAMARYFGRMKDSLLRALEKDSLVRGDAFDEAFTPEMLSDFVLDSLLSLLSRRKQSCEPLLSLLRRALY